MCGRHRIFRLFLGDFRFPKFNYMDNLIVSTLLHLYLISFFIHLFHRVIHKLDEHRRLNRMVCKANTCPLFMRSLSLRSDKGRLGRGWWTSILAVQNPMKPNVKPEHIYDVLEGTLKYNHNTLKHISYYLFHKWD